MLNVVNSYVGRDFMTAIERRHLGDFWSYALLYVGVFALSTLVAVFTASSRNVSGSSGASG